MSKNYINMNKKLIKKGGRKATKISKEDFFQKIVSLHKESEEYQDYLDEDFNYDDFSETDIYFEVLMESSRIKKDLAKVKFDGENWQFSLEEMHKEEGEEPLVGVHALENGLTFLGGYAGGDWECPVFFIIYLYGKSLRGYIPSYGNTYNLDFKTAFGSETESNKYESVLEKKKYTSEDDMIQHEYISRQGVEVEESYELDWNWEALKEDIVSRIEVAM